GSADPAGPEFPAVYSLLIRRAAAASDDGLGRDIRRSSDRVLRYDGGGASDGEQSAAAACAKIRLGGTRSGTGSGHTRRVGRCIDPRWQGRSGDPWVERDQRLRE